jgi:hypothetical protein
LLDQCEEAKWIATNKGARFLPTLWDFASGKIDNAWWLLRFGS